MKNFREQYGPWSVVTGASSGIGAEFARALAEAGLHVAIVARRTEKLESLAQELRSKTGVEVKVVTADLSNEEGVKSVCALTGSLDIGLLVNNAGINTVFDAFHNQDLQTLHKMSQLNMLSLAELSHNYLNLFVQRQKGGLINVASTGSFQATPYMANYAACKAYVLSLSTALAAEVREHNVDVLALCPGPTDTEITGHVGLDPNDVQVGLMSPARVARQALADLGKKDLVIPGAANYLGAQLAQRIMPRKILTSILLTAVRRMANKA